MTPFSLFLSQVQEALFTLKQKGVLPIDLECSGLTVEPPREKSHGDATTNAALVLGKKAGLAPRVFAGHLVDYLKQKDVFEEVSVAGPGFVNVRFVPNVWENVLKTILEEKTEYGRCALGHGSRVNVEFVSANPTGPLHVGHCRGAVFGDALCRLLETCGYTVVREYYINDAGVQIDCLARSLYHRYVEHLTGVPAQIPEGLYPGAYLIPAAVALEKKYGGLFFEKSEETWMPPVREFGVSYFMEKIRQDLGMLSIEHDVFFSEKTLHESGKISNLIEKLEQKGLVYLGFLPPPKGEENTEWEDRAQTLFRAEKFGDDSDRALLKSDGTYTYFAADMAYAEDKIGRGFSDLIYVLGADHGGYTARLKAIIDALTEGGPPVVLDAQICQLVKLFRGGTPVKMSKRAGTFVTLREIVEEVGADVVRFMMLYRKNDAPLDFDFQKALEQSKENPVFYVQYAHARIFSVLRKAQEEGISFVFPEKDIFLTLKDETELELIKKLSEYPRVVELAGIAREPHRVAFYLYELASIFHALWNKGKENPLMRFILPSHLMETQARLALLSAVQVVLANGLALLGVTPLSSM